MPDDAALFDLATRVGQRLLAARQRMVTAESCTAGWIAKAMTDVAGSSQWFECGYVTYSNAAKVRDLGVSQQTLDAHGAVSEETVREMALGALRVSGADVAVAVSGIAGPDGGVPGKPVGTVWFAVACRRGADIAIECRRQLFDGDREAVRRRSVEYALELILQLVRPEPTRRLFFALWPDEAMQAALAEAARPVVEASGGVAVPAGKLHFTLAFLGSVAESRIKDLGPIGERVAATFQRAMSGGTNVRSDASGPESPISITLDRIEYWKKSQLLCATASAGEPASVIALAAGLTRALTAHGFAPDLKPFRAHATLARKVRRVTREQDMPPVRWSFRDFRLVESRTAPEGSVYSSCEIWPLYARSR